MGAPAKSYTVRIQTSVTVQDVGSPEEAARQAVAWAWENLGDSNGVVSVYRDGRGKGLGRLVLCDQVEAFD